MQFFVANGCGGNLSGIAEHLPVQKGLDPFHHDPLLIALQSKFVLEVFCDSPCDVVDSPGVLFIRGIEVGRAIREQIPLTVGTQLPIPEAEGSFKTLRRISTLQQPWVFLRVVHGLQLWLACDAWRRPC